MYAAAAYERTPSVLMSYWRVKWEKGRNTCQATDERSLERR
jgi:hypothetical protein